ncbi:MAG: hypothetical protein M1816_006619 [Peltula sp. TS41687]|nr:MAG: hypothetical protein M1816_006619 [Peltula sp. TS41687]
MPPTTPPPPTSQVTTTSPSGSSTTAAPAPTTQCLSPEKPRLSEQEKKNNHIVSEQKRRQAIREGFDRLTELVPGLEGQARSESIVLKKSVDFMRQSVEERRALVKEIEQRGGVVPEALRG